MAAGPVHIAVRLPGRFLAAVRRGLSKFLAVPLLIVCGFLVLNALTYQVDRLWSVNGGPAYFQWLGRLLGDNAALNGLLATIASSIITVTSITFSLLPVAVQQGASALTAQVSDQFLLRRMNQVYFGFFIGLSIFVLVTLVTTSSFHRPVFSAALALILTAAALCMIVIMIYNTIDQMRPGPIIGAIHQHILRAREHERKLLEATRPLPAGGTCLGLPMRARESGFLARLDPDRLTVVLAKHGLSTCQLQVLAPIGASVAYGDPLFQLRGDGTAPGEEALRALAADLLEAAPLDDDRDLTCDPSYGFYQLSMIGWTSVSTSKSNPGPGIALLNALRDILRRWDADVIERSAASRIVYTDRTVEAGLDLLENTIVVASESIQVGTLVQALDTVAIMLDGASEPLARRLEDIALCALSSLGEHVMTARLAAALNELESALRRRGFEAAACSVADAAAGLASSVGRLNSRSTRVPTAA